MKKHFFPLLFLIAIWSGVAPAFAASSGTVLAWGRNIEGQATIPVAAQSGVIAISGGDGHTLALTTNGSVVAWGRNSEFQTVIPVAAQSGVNAISAGLYHSVALKNGSVMAWGYNSNGQTNVPAAA